MDPELSWKYESGPAGTDLRPRHRARRRQRGHALVRIVTRVRAGRRDGRLHLPGPVEPEPEESRRVRPALAEGVVDNVAKFDPTESESIVIGTGFGTTPDIQQGPDGNLYLVSITDGAIYMISHK